MARKNKISAPGKLILSGEHAVVYGHPALLTAVNRRLTANLLENGEVDIQSNIPIGAGMGSSAAYAVVMTALKTLFSKSKLDLEKICDGAYKLEKMQHGNPSGADNTICTYGGFLWYRKEAESVKTFHKIKPIIKTLDFVLVNSGLPIESTKEMVTLVKDLYQQNPVKIGAIFREIELISKRWLKHLIGETNEDLFDLIRKNEYLLERLGVVSKKTKKIIRWIEKAGGAAKISGAGGKKDGSGIVLVYGIDHKKLNSLCLRMNLDKFNVKLGEEGVKYG